MTRPLDDDMAKIALHAMMADASWWPAHHVLPVMIQHHCKSGLNSAVEVGVAFGSMLLSLGRAFPFMNITGVDPFAPYEGPTTDSMSDFMSMMGDKAYEFVQWRIGLEQSLRERVILARMTSREAAALWQDESQDAVFIDANHEEQFVREDIGLWLPKVKVGGVLCGHDYGPTWPGVARAVHGELPSDGTIAVHEGSQIWMYVKTDTIGE